MGPAVKQSSWLAIPLAMAALALGYGAQGLTTQSSGQRQDDVMDALMAAPTPRSRSVQGADQLRGIRTQRSGSGLSEPSQGSPVNLTVKVALLGTGTSPTISALGPWRLVRPGGELLQQGQAGQSVNLESLWPSNNASGLVREAGGSPGQAEEAWFLSQGAAVLVNGVAYDGQLMVFKGGGRLTVVNLLSLESYVASVVGSEMPSSWSMEALRAQAVAARSYALAHMARPANRHWHLGDNTRWQAYKGLKTKTERTRQAVDSTAGLILSYQGAIVESLYAATREISLEAHGHLGASMSQHGAEDLARQGRRYNEILGHYYQGASLARLRAGAS